MWKHIEGTQLSSDNIKKPNEGVKIKSQEWTLGWPTKTNAQCWAEVSMCHQQLRLCESLVWLPTQKMAPSLLVLPHHLEDKFLLTPGNIAFCCIISHGWVWPRIFSRVWQWQERRTFVIGCSYYGYLSCFIKAHQFVMYKQMKFPF